MEFVNPGSGVLITYNYLRDGVFDSGDGVFDLASTGMHIHIVLLCQSQRHLTWTFTWVDRWSICPLCSEFSSGTRKRVKNAMEYLAALN